MNEDKYSGFILILEYPGSKKLGHFEPYTSGYFLNYPKIWQPVYTPKYVRERKLNEILK